MKKVGVFFGTQCTYSTKNISQSSAQCVLSVYSTSCNNERQSFAKLSYNTIDNVLTNLLPAGLQLLSGAQHFECDDGSKQAVGVLPVYWIVHSSSFFNLQRTNDALSSLLNGRIFIFTSTTSAMTSDRILITAEYLNPHCLSVFLFVYALHVLKTLFYANFRKLG